MKILENQNLIGKYERVFVLALLGLQYIFLFTNAGLRSEAVLTQYSYLFFFDISSIFLVVFFLFFSRWVRSIILAAIFISSLMYFLYQFGFNSIYFNTFLSIFFSYRFLFFKLSNAEEREMLKKQKWKWIVLFPLIFLIGFLDRALEYFGMLSPETLGENSPMMSTSSKILLIGGYYGILAYLEYRDIRKKEKVLNSKKV